MPVTPTSSANRSTAASVSSGGRGAHQALVRMRRQSTSATTAATVRRRSGRSPQLASSCAFR